MKKTFNSNNIYPPEAVAEEQKHNYSNIAL
jgi:hypothetical protein